MTSFPQNDAFFKFEKSGSFVLFFALFALLAWRVTAPLMSGILWAALLSFIVMPVFQFLDTRLRFRGKALPSVSAAITLAAVAVVIILPLLLIFVSLGSEVTKLVTTAANFFGALEPDQARDPYTYFPSWTPAWIADQLAAFLSDTESVREMLQSVATWTETLLTGASKRLLQGASSFVFDLVIVLMTSFFFIRNGVSIVDYIKSITPLKAGEKQFFFTRARHMTNSVVYGVVLTVAVQALLGALGWWISGRGSPAFFGMLMFIFGMFPAGTAAVWVPDAIYLAATGDVKNAAFLFIWGVVLVSSIDNFLRPFLIKKTGSGEDVPTLLIILGLFGGVIAWGFIGVFLGPLVMVLFTIVLDIYRSRWLEQQEEQRCS